MSSRQAGNRLPPPDAPERAGRLPVGFGMPVSDTPAPERGVVSVAALLVLFALSILALAEGTRILHLERRHHSAIRELEVETVLRGKALEIVEALRTDATPEAHSMHDDAWHIAKRMSASGLTVELRDVSPRVRPAAAEAALAEAPAGRPEVPLNVNTVSPTALTKVLGDCDVSARKASLCVHRIMNRRRLGEIDPRMLASLLSELPVVRSAGVLGTRTRFLRLRIGDEAGQLRLVLAFRPRVPMAMPNASGRERLRIVEDRFVMHPAEAPPDALGGRYSP